MAITQLQALQDMIWLRQHAKGMSVKDVERELRNVQYTTLCKYLSAKDGEERMPRNRSDRQAIAAYRRRVEKQEGEAQ